MEIFIHSRGDDDEEERGHHTGHILVNVLIVLSILTFVLLYTHNEAESAIAAQIDAF